MCDLNSDMSSLTLLEIRMAVVYGWEKGAEFGLEAFSSGMIQIGIANAITFKNAWKAKHTFFLEIQSLKRQQWWYKWTVVNMLCEIDP